MKKLSTILFALVISGCAATGPIYQAAPEPIETDALVYIYRPGAFAFSAQDAYFYVDGVNITDLTNEGYTWFHAPAGEHTLKQKWFGIFAKTLEKKTNWLPRQTYFYRLEISTGLIVQRWSLSEVPAERARAEIACCKLQPAFGAEKLQQATKK